MKLCGARSSKLLVLALLVSSLAIEVGTPPSVAAYSLISEKTLLRVCRDVYSPQKFSSVKQLDPNKTKRTSLAQTAVLCDDYAPVLIVDLASRACNGMVIPAYEPRPRFSPPWVKAKFKGWACS